MNLTATIRGLGVRNPIAFAAACNPEFEVADHLLQISSKLKQLERRKIKRLMVFMPPRHGKSFLISQYFPAWYLGRNPTHQVIFTSYSQDVATDFGRKVRNLMDSQVFKELFSEIQITGDSSAAKRFELTSGGVYYATGAGGPLVGRGADLIIIDDIHKNKEEAFSIDHRKRIHEWYGSTLFTRLMPNAVMIVVQTRWHPEDLPGMILNAKTEDWDVLCLPAINDSGIALWPERFDLESLQRIKSTIGSHDFESLYQQRPSMREGSIIKRDWIQYYDTEPVRYDYIIQSWDLAFKGGETNDYVVGQVWGKVAGRSYLIDQVRARMDFPETINAFLAFTAKHPQATIKLVEEKANGAALIASLKKQVSGIIPVNPDKSKEVRVHAVAPLFESGSIFLPRQASWISDYVEELVNVPATKHDDQVDATTQALTRLQLHASGDWSDTLNVEQSSITEDAVREGDW